jgi:hypothetical protein
VKYLIVGMIVVDAFLLNKHYMGGSFFWSDYFKSVLMWSSFMVSVKSRSFLVVIWF